MKKRVFYGLTAICLSSVLALCSCEAQDEAETEVQTTEVITTEAVTEPETEEETTEDAAEKIATYFNDAVFIGDSVSMALRNRCESTDRLPGASFLTRPSYGTGHAVNGTMYLTYQGSEMAPEDAVKEIGAKKVFMMFGMNDLNIYGLEGTIDNWRTLTQRIREKNPDVEIFVQSMTPVMAGSESGKLNNPTIDEYNEMLKEFALEESLGYIDIATPLKNEDNSLNREYSFDNYVHLNDAGIDNWIETLESFVENQFLGEQYG